MKFVYEFEIWFLAAIDDRSCYRLSIKPAVPSGPFGNRITLSSMRRSSTGFCGIGWFCGEPEFRPYNLVELIGGLDVADAAVFRPSDGLLVKLSVIDPFVSFVPLPFLFTNIAGSLWMANRRCMWISWDNCKRLIFVNEWMLTLLHLRHFWPNPKFWGELQRILVHVAAKS